ncbi:hypothetical protein [Microbacterium saperdae]|uniref:Uncharacterized protein n=1 Tax=Microbacterium saperdae TaxID=69368 RepID=A0A543BP31_9MICO|nr:hypothetical protein [Microbacterium saperdae]TQL86580.1 hypothetical protein FB560_2242 [Microbacterium saperdae]GGM46920.1 hypothetical protein GCM10010489_17740 [Microbacterium saperdae]
MRAKVSTVPFALAAVVCMGVLAGCSADPHDRSRATMPLASATGSSATPTPLTGVVDAEQVTYLQQLGSRIIAPGSQIAQDVGLTNATSFSIDTATGALTVYPERLPIGVRHLGDGTPFVLIEGVRVLLDTDVPHIEFQLANRQGDVQHAAPSSALWDG